MRPHTASWCCIFCKPFFSQSCAGMQSSSVKATISPRAWRQPRLRAVAGPSRVRLSSTTMTSNSLAGKVWRSSASRQRASRSGRPQVGTTTDTAGMASAAAVVAPVIGAVPADARRLVRGELRTKLAQRGAMPHGGEAEPVDVAHAALLRRRHAARLRLSSHADECLAPGPVAAALRAGRGGAGRRGFEADVEGFRERYGVLRQRTLA